MVILQRGEKLIYHFIHRDPDLHEGKIITLSEYESRHLAKSLRIKEGDMVNIVNGDGSYYRAKIENAGKIVTAVIISREKPLYVKEFRLNAIIPVIKKNRFELMLEKLTELGVDGFFPYYSLQGSSVPDRTRDSFCGRWEAILLSSVKQSKRAEFPFIRKPDKLKSILSGNELKHSNYKKLILEIGQDKLGRDLRGDILFIVGPEGGFSQEERLMIADHGFEPAGISDFQLRTETAALIFCGIIQYLKRG